MVLRASQKVYVVRYWLYALSIKLNAPWHTMAGRLAPRLAVLYIHVHARCRVYGEYASLVTVNTPAAASPIQLLLLLLTPLMTPWTKLLNFSKFVLVQFHFNGFLSGLEEKSFCFRLSPVPRKKLHTKFLLNFKNIGAVYFLRCFRSLTRK